MLEKGMQCGRPLVRWVECKKDSNYYARCDMISHDTCISDDVYKTMLEAEGNDLKWKPPPDILKQFQEQKSKKLK